MKKIPGRIALAALCLWLLPQSVFAAQLLVPVGQVVGLELGGNTVTVAAFDDVLGAQAREAGLQVGDEIGKINDQEVTSAEDGEPIIGASVKVVGTNTGTVTDIDGNFSLVLPINVT